MGVPAAEITTEGSPEAVIGAPSNREPDWTQKFKFPFLRTQRFWLVLFFGQIVALGVTGSSTFSSLLAIRKNASIPAFQNILVYSALFLVYGGFTIYTYGFKGYGKMLLKEGWKYFILAFFDVEGNYFAVLAYRYTTILSAQLISFFSIVVVVIISFLFLKVRYHWSQIVGILVCCGGMGLLMASDHIHLGSRLGGAPTELKGDLFMLLASFCYGLSNVAEEFLVSKRPLYEVVGQIGFWGILINGVQFAIFDRNQFRSGTWDGQTAGYLIGFTCCLFVFYTIAPLLFRMASAAFFNISLLTASFWTLIIGIRVFGYTIFYLYGVAFCLIIVGLVIYYVMSDVLGESKKPWLGEGQEGGIEGVGTAKKTLADASKAASADAELGVPSPSTGSKLRR